MIHKCNSLYKAHTTCNKKPVTRAGGSGHARDYGGWGWERDLNCAPRSSNSLSLTARALLVLQTTKAVLEAWERGSPHSRRIHYIRTRKYSPVVVYILTKQLLFLVSHLCAYEKQSKKMHALTSLILVLSAASTLASPGHPSCGPPEIPSHGSVEGGARSSYDLGEYVQYACDRGYRIQRPNVAVCIYRDGGPAWNNPPPQCTRKI